MAATVLGGFMATLEREDMQGLIVRGYGDLPAARFLLLRFHGAANGRAWLSEIVDLLSHGGPRPDRKAPSQHLALTCAGLSALGLPDTALSTFAREFQEGLTNPHRSRILGDHDDSDPA